MSDSGAPSGPGDLGDAEDRAYYAHPDSNESEDAYVCWDCATPDERADPVPNNDAVGEQCCRCEAWWDYADA